MRNFGAVAASPLTVEVATEQFKAEEKQRVFGIIPNFYVSYDSDRAPLTTGMKFQLALKISADPSYGCGSLFCTHSQASWKYSELWPRLGSIWEAPWRTGRREATVETPIHQSRCRTCYRP